MHNVSPQSRHRAKFARNAAWFLIFGVLMLVVVPLQSRVIEIRDNRDVVGNGALQVHLSFDDGSSTEGVQVMVRSLGTSRRVGVKRRQADKDGFVLFENLPSGEVKVDIDRALISKQGVVSVVQGETTKLSIVIRVGILIRGRVENSDGNPVVGASIWMGPCAIVAYDAVAVERSGDDGTFTIRTAHNPCVVWARCRDYEPSAMILVHGKIGDAREVRLKLLASGGNVQGVVLDPAGKPLGGVVVRIGRRRLDRLVVGRSSVAPSAQVYTDAKGIFRVEGVRIGEHAMSVRAIGLAPWKGTCKVSVAEWARVYVCLKEGARIVGVVRDEMGAPVTEAVLRYGEAGSLLSEYVTTDHEGMYGFSGILPGLVEIHARHHYKGRAKTTVNCASGEQTRCDLTLSRGRELRGRVLLDGGLPLVGATICVWTQPRPGVLIEEEDVLSGHDGRFWVGNLGDGGCRVQVIAVGYKELKVDGIFPESGEVTLRVHARPPASAAISGQICGNTEIDRIRDARVLLLARGATQYDATTTVDDSTGEFYFASVYPDEYQLIIEAPGYPRWKSEWNLVEQNGAWSLGMLRFKKGGTILVRMGARNIQGVEAALWNAHNEWVGTVPVRRGNGESMRLRAGQYKVAIRGKEVAAQLFDVVVREAEETELIVSASKGVCQSVELCLDDGEKLCDVVRVTILQGERQVVDEPWGDTDSVNNYWLSPGKYVLKLQVGESFRQLPFVVEDTEGRPLRVRVP